jgi:hypothetical protein
MNKEIKDQPTSESLPIGNANVSRRFKFGQWVLLDGEISAQIIDAYEDDWWMIDIEGKWSAVAGHRLNADKRYLNGG